MANIKFSDFAVRTTIPTVDYIVGYQGADNIQISPTDLLGDYLPLAGGAMTGVTGVVVPDNFKWNFGTGSDFYIDYDGTDATIENKDGDLYIVNSAGAGITGKNIYFQSDGGYGSAATYFYLDGSSGAATNYTRWPDEARIAFGDSKDFRMWFDGVGTNMYMTNYGGDFWFSNEQTDGDIIFRSDNGAGSLAEYFRLDGGDVETIFSKNTVHLDNVKAKFGGGNDLQIYHDGSNSYIEDTGTGNLILKAANRLYIFDDGGDYMAAFKKDDAVELYYDGLKKFETTATGIQVTDEVSIGTSLVHTGDTDTKVSFGTNNITLIAGGATYLDCASDQSTSIYSGNAQTIFCDTNQRVGIGTTAPSTLLYVEGVISTQRVGVAIAYGTREMTGDGHELDTAVSGYHSLIVKNNGTEQMRVNSSGDMGIGTDSPVAKLSVTGASAAANDIGIFQVTTGTGAHTDTKLTVGVVDNDYVWVEAGTPGTAIRDFVINPRGGGNVGIGTTAPSYPLEISNNTSTSIAYQRTGVSAKKWGFHSDNDATYWQNITDGSFNLTIQNGGNVGIGTTAPVNKQQNKYTGVAIASMTATAGTASTNWNRSAGLLIEESNSSNGLALGVSETANDRKSWIQSGHPGAAANVLGTLSLNPLGGNVGIGTTTPFTNLDVRSSAVDTIIRLKADGGTADIRTWEMRAVGVAGEGLVFRQVNDANNVYTNRMILDTSGNVGIGTVTPTAALQVVGLVEYADNAAAITAGLTAGAFYRTGDLLKVVH